MQMLIAVVVLQASAVVMAETPIVFTQAESNSPITLSATGNVSSDGNGLVVQLSDFEVADQPANPSTYVYDRYRVCLADAEMEIASCSDPVKVLLRVESGSESVPDRKLRIPAPGTGGAEGLRLVLELTSRPVGGKTHYVQAASQPLPWALAAGTD